MIRTADRGRYAAECDLEDVYGCEAPDSVHLINRLTRLRGCNGRFAAFARGYLLFYIESDLICVESADWVLFTVAEEHWLVHHMPRTWIENSASSFDMHQ